MKAYHTVPALIVALFLATVLGIAYYNTVNAKPAEQPTPLQFNVKILSQGIADYENKSTAYASINAKGEGVQNASIELYWLENQPQTTVRVLEYPAIEATKLTEFTNSMKKTLEEYGIETAKVKISELEQLSNTIIIVPTGALPAKLNEPKELGKILSQKNVVIYYGMPFTYSLNEDGSLTQTSPGDVKFTEAGKTPTTSLRESQVKTIKETYSISFQQGYAYINPKTIDSLENPEKEGEKLARKIIENAWQEPLGKANESINGTFKKNTTLFTTENKAEKGFPRIIFQATSKNETKKGFLDAWLAEKKQGTIETNGNAFPKETIPLSILLKREENTTKKLELSLKIYQGETLETQQKISEANMRDVWITQANYENNLEPGNHLMKIQDQYGAVYAQAKLHVKNLSITLTKERGVDYEFTATIDGSPVDKQQVEARVDESNVTTKTWVNNGKFTVSAAMPKGEHAFNFILMGTTQSIPYARAKETTGEFYLKYGVPVLIIIGAVYFLLNKKDKRKLKLLIPEAAEEKLQTVQMNTQEFLNVFNIVQKERGWQATPLKLAEIRNGLRKHVTREGRGIMVTDSNLANVLGQLEEKGTIKSWGEYYAPTEWANESMETLAIKRITSEALLTKGIEHEQNGSVITTENGEEKTFYHVITGNANGNKKKILNYMKKGENILVFPNSERIKQFKNSLNEYDEESIQLKLEIEKNKVKLATASNIGEATT